MEKKNILDLVMKDTLENEFLKNNNEDYSKNGILYCHKCNMPKETIINIDGLEIKTRVMCKCEREEYIENKKLEDEKERKILINDFKNENIKPFKNFKFENAIDCKETSIAKKYCLNFKNMIKNNVGLMIYGGTGNGKTYIAGCIANFLIEEGYKVMMLNILDALEYVQDNFDKTGKKEIFIDKLKTFDLVIIDDFGMETNSEFELKNISKIINTRYEYNLPIIITTNITRVEMEQKNCKIQQKRIYSRLIEMTHPIKVEKQDIRFIKSHNRESSIISLLSEDE